MASLGELGKSMNGIINLDKPVGITSAKAVYKVRAITAQRKSGHAGTLDPGASGVLVVCLGKATKLVELVMDQPKVYRATARLDVTSASLDADRPMEPVDVAVIPAFAAVSRVCGSFEGLIEQVPPQVSALKVGGVPAYKLAKKGSSIKLAPRRVQVYWMHVHRYEWPEIDFEVACGRGTYVRALIRDIGVKLDTGGCLTSLSRKQIGPFLSRDGWSFERLSAADGPGEFLIELDRARDLLSAERVEIPSRPEQTPASESQDD